MCWRIVVKIVILISVLVILVLSIMTLKDVKDVKKNCVQNKQIAPKLSAEMNARSSRKVGADNPAVIIQLLKQYCNNPNQDPMSMIPAFNTVMAGENNMQGSLWNDGDGPYGTDDDNVAAYICNYNGTAVAQMRQMYPGRTATIDSWLNGGSSSGGGNGNFGAGRR